MTDPHPSDVAIIGMACRFPGAPDVPAYARLVFGGELATHAADAEELAARSVPRGLREHPDFVPTAGTLTDVDQFDAAYFGIAPADAEAMDPQQRLLLQEAVHALDDAGWPVGVDRRVGVFCGAGENRYAARLGDDPVRPRPPWDLPAALPLLVSYHLDLRGPSVFVNTLCSTSITAVHLARRALQAGDCEVALAGAASVRLPDSHGYLARAGGIMSPAGRCRPFDHDADGTVPGSGVAVLVLKKLADASRDGDRVYAVIRGSAVNNDGSDRLSFAAPSVRGQRDVITAAFAEAGIDAGSVGYVEAHGTGTPLGDPVELASLAEARAALGATGPCAIGAVKSAIGHLDEAAGMAGLIKAVLAVGRGVVPPTPGHENLNPAVRLAGTGLYVSTEPHDWPVTDGPRRAAVTALGVGGTNGHVIVEQPVANPLEHNEPALPELLPISAHSPAAFAELRAELASSDAPPASLAATLSRRRQFGAYRQAVIAATTAELTAALAEPATEQPSGITLELATANETGRAELETLGVAPDGDPALALVAALGEIGVRPDSLGGAGAGAYLALAAASSVPPDVAVRCAELHAEGERVADSEDLTRCDELVDEIVALLTETGVKPQACAIVLRASGIELPAGAPVSLDDVAEESRSAFMGLLELPAPPEAHDVAAAVGGRRELLNLVGACWERGADVRWAALRPVPEAPRAPLRFPFDTRRFWAAAELADPAPEPVEPARPDDVPTEVANIWREVLGVTQVSPQDSFFALGGHSILAARMLARLLDRLDVRVSLGDLLEAETMAGMTDVVADHVRLAQLYAQVQQCGEDEGSETVDL